MTTIDVLDLIGRPYARGARGPDAFDCWGLCVEVYRRRGIELPDYRDDTLTREQVRALIDGHAVDHADWLIKPEAWCFVYARRSGHIGIFTAEGYVLHAARGQGVVQQRLDLFEALHPSVAFARWVA